jgi:predicted transcriptional regulator
MSRLEVQTATLKIFLTRGDMSKDTLAELTKVDVTMAYDRIANARIKGLIVRKNKSLPAIFGLTDKGLKLATEPEKVTHYKPRAYTSKPKIKLNHSRQLASIFAYGEQCGGAAIPRAILITKGE